jgi:hypothetical protein
VNLLGPIEILIEPELTYMLGNDVHPYVGRVYTDGPDWPESFEARLARARHRTGSGPTCARCTGKRELGAAIMHDS